MEGLVDLTVKKKRGGRKEQRKINQNNITGCALKLNKCPNLKRHIREVPKIHRQVRDPLHGIPTL